MTLFPDASLLLTDRNDENVTLDLGGSLKLTMLVADEPSRRVTLFH